MKILFFLSAFLVVFSFSDSRANVTEAPILMPADFEQNPTSMKWRHILTDHFDIIFPKELESEAQRVANLLEKAYPFVTRSLETLPPRIPLILQNQSLISNGFVTLAPRRSEWYVTPAVDPVLTNTEWLKTLSIHEFRHVVQFQKSRQGNFNKFLEIILGEIGQAAGLGLSLPPWYLEGDAVGMETALSRGGRGRLPLFDRDLRTLLLSGKDFSYDKAHLGSFDDYVPNHYVYGYFYTSYLRNEYGDLFLSKLADDSTHSSWNPLTFYNAVDYATKKKFETFYADTMKSLITEWKAKADQLSPTPYTVLNLGKKFGWTNYFYPQVTEDNKVVALKRGLSFFDRFVLIDGKKEKTLFYPGPLNAQYPYKLRNNRIAFMETQLDPRWGYRDFSRLKVFDIKKKKFVLDKAGTKGRLAVLNHAADKIVMIEWDDTAGQFILVLNSKGKEVRRLEYPKDQVITSVDWIDDQNIVMVVKDHDDMKSIKKYNLEDHTEEVLLEKGINNIGFVTSESEHILYESPESGIDNVFLLTSAGPRQLTSAMFGSYAPNLKDGTLTYNDYTVDGMNIVKKTLSWEEEQKSQDSFYPVYEKFAQSEKFDELESAYLKAETYKSKKYSQTKHALNFHSWMVLAPPLSSTITLVGISRDVLNKFALEGGGSYNLNEGTPTGFAAASWTHLYPVFDIRAAYGNRRQDLRFGGRTISDKWEEGTFEGGIAVPWTYIQGRFIHQFTTRAFSKIIKVTNKLTSDTAEVSDGALFSPGIELQYAFVSRMAVRDLNPSLGFMLMARAEEGNDISGTKQSGSIRSVDSRIFLPGTWHHHSFYHQLAYERQNDRSYEYASPIFYTRGTRYVFLQEFAKYSGNYMMPIFYPDYNLSRYLNFKRINFNLFYDALSGRYGNVDYRASSTGWESIFEMNVLRLAFPISLGVRGSYVFEGLEKKSNYELFLTTGLGSF